VAAAIAKRRERSFYVPVQTLSGIAGYVATTRRDAILRAQRAGRYDRLAGKLIVAKASAGQRRLAWDDGLGRRGEYPVTAIDERQRRRLFVEGDDGLEPLQLWLTDGGLPMDYRSWEAVFAAANARCLRFGKPIGITPHTCRHSFALQRGSIADSAWTRRRGESEVSVSNFADRLGFQRRCGRYVVDVRAVAKGTFDCSFQLVLGCIIESLIGRVFDVSGHAVAACLRERD
jgi:hypothetical protein